MVLARRSRRRCLASISIFLLSGIKQAGPIEMYAYGAKLLGSLIVVVVVGSVSDTGLVWVVIVSRGDVGKPPSIMVHACFAWNRSCDECTRRLCVFHGKL